MSCLNCSKAKPLPTCTTSLVIGTVSNSTAVYIYFKKISNGRVERLSATSSNAGLVTATLTSIKDFFSPGSQYEVWITLASATNTQSRQTITIGTDTDTCFLLTFLKVQGQSYTSQTIVLE